MPQIASKLEPTFVGPVLDANLLEGQVPVANGGTGVDSLSSLKTNLNLNNVDNTADVNKPVSTAQASAISTALATNLANFNAVLAQTQTARDEALNYGSAIVKYNWYEAEALTGLANNAGVIVLSSDTGTHISVSGDFGAVDGQTPNSGFYQYSTLIGKLVRRSDLESALISILKDQIELAATRTEAFASSITTTLDNYVSDSIAEGLADSSIPNNSFFPVVTNDGRHYLVKKINSTTAGTTVEYNTVTAFLAESAIVNAVKDEALQYSNATVVASWTEAAALTGLANNAAVYVLSVDAGTHTSVAGDYGSVSGQTPNSGYYAYSTSLAALVRKAPLESSLVKGYRDQTKAYFDALGQMFEGYIFTTVAEGLADPSVPNNSFFPVISDDSRHYVVYKDGTGAAGQTIEYATAFSGIEAPRVRAAYTALAAMGGWVDGMYGMVTAADTGTHTSASGDVGESGGQTPNRGHYVYSAAQSKLIRVGDLESYISTINKNLTEAYANTLGTMFDGYIYQTTAEGLADSEVPNGTFFPVVTADNRRYDVFKVDSTTAGQIIEYPTITYLDNNHTKITDLVSTVAGKGIDLISRVPYPVPDRASLAGLDTAKYKTAVLYESGREGVFRWNSSNLSTAITADPQQGIYVAPSSDTSGSTGAWVRIGYSSNSGIVNVLWFGAKTDNSIDTVGTNGAANKTAFQAAINFVEAMTGLSPQGCGEVVVPPGRFVIGGGSDTIGLTLTKANLIGAGIFETTLVWGGVLNGTVVRVDQTYRKRINGFRWNNAPNSGSTTKPKFWIDATYDAGLGGVRLMDFGDNWDNNFWTDVSSATDSAAIKVPRCLNFFMRNVRFQGGSRWIHIYTQPSTYTQFSNLSIQDWTADYSNSGAGVFSEGILFDVTGQGSLTLNLENARLEGSATMATNPALVRVIDTVGPNLIPTEPLHLSMRNIQAVFTGATGVNLVYLDSSQTNAVTCNISLDHVVLGKFSALQGNPGVWQTSNIEVEPTFSVQTSIKFWRSGRVNSSGMMYVGKGFTQGNIKSGSTTSTTNGSGIITVTHGFGKTPVQVIPIATGSTFYHIQPTTKTSTTFNVIVLDAAGTPVDSTSVSFDWMIF